MRSENNENKIINNVLARVSVEFQVYGTEYGTRKIKYKNDVRWGGHNLTLFSLGTCNAYYIFCREVPRRSL